MFKLNRGDRIQICFSENESEAVKIAINNLKTDLEKAVGVMADIVDATNTSVTATQIVIGTVDVAKDILENYEIPEGMYKEGKLRKEAYLHKVSNDRLVIVGSDRRGTIYGIYELAEMLGVSPWYYFADVPVKQKDEFILDNTYKKLDYPTVEYRGFFINDEEELEKWVQLHLGEETIGLKAYEKIFELLLRLKINYLWPAMHVNSFNMVPENGALADRMGIVIGTSHCDMLMRSNNREWLPWKTKKGYDDALYDYSLEGRNREILKEYWQESIEQNKNFEVSYTLGMRGVHDSGFEIRALEGLEGDELFNAKVKLLETIIETQDQMLKDSLDYEPVKIFVPYKEVLPLYDSGLKVPEDFTLIWANDNYGYVRRYPSAKERERKGGNGIYYHNSYWAGSGRSYVFMNSIPLTHTKNELTKAYNEGIQKLWIMNIGAMKPLEIEMEFFSHLAWEITKEDALTNDVDTYLADFIDRNFTGNHGKEVADIINELLPLANMRKIENMDNDIFSQNAYGDEAAVRVNKLKALYDRANKVYEAIKEEEKAAFFQMVMLRVHAQYYTACQYYFADRSALCVAQGKMQAAKLYTDYSKEYDDARRKLLHYYDNIMSEGKWKGMVTPEDFPPPKTALHPVCTPPLFIGGRKMLVCTWNDEKDLTFVKPSAKWFEIANAGSGEFEFEIEAPEWVKLSECSGVVAAEKRIIVSVDSVDEDKCGEIVIHNITDRTKAIVPVVLLRAVTKDGHENIEDGGIISVNAENVDAYDGFVKIKKLGRGMGNLLEGREPEAVVSYPVYLVNDCEKAMLEIHRSPSLNSVGRIRIAVALDNGEWQEVETLANDEKKSTWPSNSLNNVDKLYLEFNNLAAGEHTVSFKVIDKYFAFTKFALYTKERKRNSAAVLCGNEMLPVKADLDSLTTEMYGDISLSPRVLYCGIWAVPGNSLLKTDIPLYPESYGAKKSVEELLSGANSIFKEENGIVKIDAITAYMQTEYAYTANYEWQYCNTESYGREGLGLYTKGAFEKTVEAGPALNYKIDLDGADCYTVWALMKINVMKNGGVAVSVDGEELPREEQYNKRGRVWRYEAEHNWRWIPLAKTKLSAGEHRLTISALESDYRFDRIIITNNEEMPITDMCW
ncbi:MAG: glycosyl hydrolase 115 family protein [Lachnospiraceae bacterium]|nr:glycosyl hydrolase 115 family protein [Lachnospiraceae bacterium]